MISDRKQRVRAADNKNSSKDRTPIRNRKQKRQDRNGQKRDTHNRNRKPNNQFRIYRFDFTSFPEAVNSI
jgi:hypothetical protein